MVKTLFRVVQSKDTVVSDLFEVVNGMSGLMRDVILNLSSLMCEKPHGIRAIFGICEEFWGWKNHPYFVYERKKRHTSFITNPYL
jgi:hypothetical protein